MGIDGPTPAVALRSLLFWQYTSLRALGRAGMPDPGPSPPDQTQTAPDPTNRVAIPDTAERRIDPLGDEPAPSPACHDCCTTRTLYGHGN